MPKKYLFLPLLILIALLAAGMPYLNGGGADKPAEQQNAPAQEAISEDAGESGPSDGYTAFAYTWRAVVSGDTIDLEGEGITEGVYKVERSAYAKGVEFFGNANGVDFTLNIFPQKGTDDNGFKYDLGAKLFYGKKTYKGVAIPKAYERADT